MRKHITPENVIDLPERDTSLVDDGRFELGHIEAPPEPLKNWEEVLEGFLYDPTVMEITKVNISGVTGVEISDDTIRKAIKAHILQMAEEFIVEAGYATVFKGQVYGVLIKHVRDKFLGGISSGLAERGMLVFAWKMLPSVRKNIQSIPGLIGGIIEYGN